MSELSDKVSYLRGLTAGLHLNEGDNQAKILAQIVETLGDAAEQIDSLHEELDELSEYVETIDEDLEELEDIVDDDSEDDEDDEDEYDFAEESDDEDEEENADDQDEHNPELVRFTAAGKEDDSCMIGCVCPECGGMFSADGEMLECGHRFVCPHCGKAVEGKPLDSRTIPAANPAEDDE